MLESASGLAGVQIGAIIGDLKGHTPLSEAQPHIRLRRLRVAKHVAEGFLCDAIQCGALLSRQALIFPDYLNRHRQTGSPGEGLRLLAECAAHSFLAGEERPQIEDVAADFQQRLPYEKRQIVELGAKPEPCSVFSATASRFIDTA